MEAIEEHIKYNIGDSTSDKNAKEPPADGSIINILNCYIFNVDLDILEGFNGI